MDKTALVVSGGGSKGAFAVGAIEVLRKHGVAFDLVTGTSTGALIAPLVATDEIPLLRTIYSTVRTPDILTSRGGIDILSGDAFYDTTPLWRLVNTYITDERYQRILASKTDVFVCAANLQDGQSYYFNPKKSKDGPPLARDVFCRAVLASASEPVLMPPVRVPSPTGDQFVDGGIRDISPIMKAIQEGATRIIAIVLTPQTRGRRNDSFSFVVDTLLRTLDILLEEVVRNDVDDAVFYNDAVRYVEAVRQRAAAFIPAAELDAVFAPAGVANPLQGKRQLELQVIRPAEALPTAGLEFSPLIMSQMMTMGEQAAERLFA
jgi:predicted acylesterase/phospholipase RssA